MKEFNISKGIAVIASMSLHILFINVYTPNMFVRVFGFLVLLFFILPGYEFAGTKVSLRKNFHDNVLTPLIYLLKYFFGIAFLYTLIMIVTGKMDLLSCIYSILCEILTESLINKIPGMVYPGTVFKSVLFVIWLIRDLIIANLLFIPSARLYMKGRIWKIISFAFLLIFSALCYVFLPDLPFQLQMIPTFSSFMLIGYILKNENVYIKFLKISKKKKIIISFSMLLICMGIASQLDINHVAAGRFAMKDSSFFSWALGMITGTLCIIPCLYGARMLSENEKISDFLLTLGRGAADANFVHMFFAMSLYQITGIKCGRCISEPIEVTPDLFLQFVISFIFSFGMSYLWLFLHRKIVAFKIKRKKPLHNSF